LDSELATQTKETHDTEKVVDKLQEAITMACDNSFRNAENNPKWMKYKLVPWWTQELTIKRKRLNALRRRYQRTRTIEERETRKKTYHEDKSRYQAAIKKEKLNSWKEYCNLTPSTNPWNSVYKITTNKHRRVLPMTTLLKSDGSYTSNLNEILQAMLDHLITRDDRTDDLDYHKRIRTKIREPSQTADDREFLPGRNQDRH